MDSKTVKLAFVWSSVGLGILGTIWVTKNPFCLVGFVIALLATMTIEIG